MHSNSDQKSSKSLSVLSTEHSTDATQFSPEKTSGPLTFVSTDEKVINPFTKTMRNIFDQINYLKKYGTFIDMIINKINIMHNNNYILGIESVNELLSKINGSVVTRLSYETKALEITHQMSDKTKLVFSVDWTKTVNENISTMFVEIYEIKRRS